MLPAAKATSRPGIVLASVIAAAVLVVANVSALNVALPQLSRELQASQTDVHWMVDIYAVFLAALLLPAGALGDRFGRRLTLLAGVAVLVLANAATVFVDSASAVIALRAVSGIGAAFVFPSTLSTITATMPEEKRSQGVAIWTAAVMFGGMLGVLFSGVLIENYWWGSVFLGMAIASLFVLLICARFVPDSSDPDEANLDPIGAVLSVLAAGGLVLGVIEGPVEGWTSPVALVGLLGGAAALVGFVMWELRTDRPLLDVRLFRDGGVRSGSLSIFVQFAAAFGFFFLTVPYLAFVLGYGPLKIGLGLMPAAIGLFPGAAVAIPLAKRFGRRPVGVVGLLILASGFLVATLITATTGFLLFGLVMAIFGLGIGLSSPPATESIVESLPEAKQGVASALNDVLREFGAAIGIAAIGAAFNSGYRAGIDQVTGLPEGVIEALRENPAAAAVLAPDLGDLAPTMLAEVSRSVVEGFATGSWLTAALVIVGALGYGIWAPSRSNESASDQPSLGSTSAQSNVIVLQPAGMTADEFDDFARAVDNCNRGAADEAGVVLQADQWSEHADVVVAVTNGVSPDIGGLVEAARASESSRPDLVLLVRGNTELLQQQFHDGDPLAAWLASHLRAGTAAVLPMETTADRSSLMSQLFEQRIDRWTARRAPQTVAAPINLRDAASPEDRGDLDRLGRARAELEAAIAELENSDGMSDPEALVRLRVAIELIESCNQRL